MNLGKDKVLTQYLQITNLFQEFTLTSISSLSKANN